MLWSPKGICVLLVRIACTYHFKDSHRLKKIRAFLKKTKHVTPLSTLSHLSGHLNVLKSPTRHGKMRACKLRRDIILTCLKL